MKALSLRTSKFIIVEEWLEVETFLTLSAYKSKLKLNENVKFSLETLVRDLKLISLRGLR